MKAVLASLDGIPEALHSEYEQRDGAYHLKIEGDLPGFVPLSVHADIKNKLTEFRDNNIALLKDAAELAGVSSASDLSPVRDKLKELSAVDPKEYAAMKKRIAEYEKTGAKQPEDVANLIAQQVDAALAPINKKLEESEANRQAAEQRANKALLRDAVGSKAAKEGARANALGFLLDKAEETFHIDGDTVKAKPNVFSKENPGKPLGVDEWIKTAIKEYDFAFEPSSGGDAPPAKPGPGGLPAKAGQRVVVNPTPQELGRLAGDIRAGKVRIENTPDS